MFYLSLPLKFLKFWFVEAPFEIFLFFVSLNRAILQLISLPLLIRTYFRPWKNEYRKGFVPVAIGLGMVIKTFVIFADLLLFSLVLFFEIAFFAFFILWPIYTLKLIFFL